MTTTVLRAQNGVQLIEAEVRGGLGMVDRQYGVTTNLSSVPLYQGRNRGDAEKAFDGGVRAAR
jgi:hypothetical protein